jgi:CRISPR-associated protein Csb1
VADAILRDSELDGVAFRETPRGKQIGLANLRNATPLFEICPTALLLGLWDSTGPKGGLGTKFQRALVSEIIGVNAQYGTRTSSRIDPLAIRKDAAVIYESATEDWTLDENQAVKRGKQPTRKGKDGKPSEANHGNIVPSLSDVSRDGVPLAGGVTIDRAVQTTVISLPAIRRLRFPINREVSRDVNVAGRTVIAALGLCGATLAAEQGLDLRSRCLLWPTEPLSWELLQSPGTDPIRFELSADDAITLLNEAVSAATDAGLPWLTEPLILKPQGKLVELVRRSQQLAVQTGGED